MFSCGFCESSKNTLLYRTQDVVLLPPANDPYASDKEEGDDDIGLAGNINLPSDITGAVEIHRDNE